MDNWLPQYHLLIIRNLIVSKINRYLFAFWFIEIPIGQLTSWRFRIGDYSPSSSLDSSKIDNKHLESNEDENVQHEVYTGWVVPKNLPKI